ncbi:eukaryotic translation initiation factor 6-like [Tribolium madens]|uniref:eukaryotic translation initiation factor 6-like n=1 Tax=Tribolium madens TaxID=41895 RepID=UPI001CF73BC7|nr:eukaryotic translation initiation factor 6-like [Tribolium madens]
MSSDNSDCCDIIPTPNYTSRTEKYDWWLLKRISKDSCRLQGDPHLLSKQQFRMRKTGFTFVSKSAFRIQYGSSNEIGAFIRLTNSYCLMGGDPQQYEKIQRLIEGDLRGIPAINTSLAGCKVVGRLCVGNKNGLLVPDLTYDTELQLIKEALPDSVKVSKIEDRLSALGNVIVCNDSVALIHPDLDRETEEVIADTLQVEVFRHMIANNALVGSHCILNNFGGLVNPDISNKELENLSSLLQLALVSGTVNQGNKLVGSGVASNDSFAYAGMKTTAREFTAIESAFQLKT